MFYNFIPPNSGGGGGGGEVELDLTTDAYSPIYSPQGFIQFQIPLVIPDVTIYRLNKMEISDILGGYTGPFNAQLSFLNQFIIITELPFSDDLSGGSGGRLGQPLVAPGDESTIMDYTSFQAGLSSVEIEFKLFYNNTKVS